VIACIHASIAIQFFHYRRGGCFYGTADFEAAASGPKTASGPKRGCSAEFCGIFGMLTHNMQVARLKDDMRRGKLSSPMEVSDEPASSP
jgi:hypothetical protein